MVLSIGTDGDADYYLGHQADYYTGGQEPVGLWYTPDEQFGLVDAKRIDNKIFRDLMDGVSPEGVTIGRAPKNPKLSRVSSYDLTFSVPKSVSILWAVSGEETRARIEELVHRSVRRTLSTAQDNAVYLRRGGGGTDVVKTRMFGALFQHGDARPMDDGKGGVVSDMNLHIHSVMFNLAQDPRGEWYALDARHLLDWKMALGATHHAELARLLESELGCRLVTTGRNGEFEVEGVPPDLITHFSRRRTLITESLKAYGLSSSDAPELAAAITRLSREAKPDAADAEKSEARFERWAREAVEQGFTAKEVLACFFEQPLSPEEIRARDEEFHLALKSLAFDITETKAVVQRRDVHKHIAALCASYGRGADDAEHLTAELIDRRPLPADFLQWDDAQFARKIDELIGSGKLVSLPNVTDKAGRPLLTSPDLIRAERGIWRLVDAHVDDARHQVPYEMVEEYIARLRTSTDPKSPPPTIEQEAGLRYVTTHPGLVVSLEGAAGSGKSITLKQVTGLYRDVFGPANGLNYRVVGCSAKWLTAKEMIDDADLPDEDARAAAKWIADLRSGKETIDERTILLVDESGQMGSRDLYDLLKPFLAAGAKVVLTGDRAQQRSVGAGPGLDIVVSRIGSLRLERTQRMEPQADDVLVHLEGVSRQEAIVRAYGVSKEKQRIMVNGAASATKGEVRACFSDPNYAVSPEDVLVWAKELQPMEALQTVAKMSEKEQQKLIGESGDDARDAAKAWAADIDSEVSVAQVFHYLDGQGWQIAERRASLLSKQDQESLLHGHGETVRAAVLAWAESPDCSPSAADALYWLDGVDRRAAEQADPGETASAERASEVRAATRAWAKANSPKPTAADVLHWVHGMSWNDAFARLDGMSSAERGSLVDLHGKEAIAAADSWLNTPKTTITATDVLVHVYDLDRANAELRANAMTEEDRSELVSRRYHAVRDDGQIWARQAATDFSYGPTNPRYTMRALQAYHDHGRLKWVQSHDDALAAAVDDWKKYKFEHPDASAVVLAKSNADIRTQNALLRAHLREAGQISPAEVIVQTISRQRNGNKHIEVELPVAVGEQILFTRRDDKLDVVNGTIGRVTAIKGSSHPGHAILTVEIGNKDGTPRVLTFDTASYTDEKETLRAKTDAGLGGTSPKQSRASRRAMIEHCYAITNFSVQGMSRTAAFAQVDSSQTSNSVYVAASRARADTFLYASRAMEDAYLTANLPLWQKDDAVFSDRDRLRALASKIARGQWQPSVLDAFDARWRERIHTERAEGYYDPEDVNWWSTSDEDIGQMCEQHLAGPEVVDVEEPDIDSLVPPDWLNDGFEQLVQSFDPSMMGGSDGEQQLSLAFPVTQLPAPLKEDPYYWAPRFRRRALARSDRDDLARSDVNDETSSPPADMAVATIAKRQEWEAPSYIRPAIVGSAGVSRWQVAPHALKSFRSSSHQLSRALARADGVWRLGTDRFGVLPMPPLDDQPAVTSSRRRNYIRYNSVERQPRYDIDRVRDEMDKMLRGGVDFRDILGKEKWRPVGTDNPALNCFWTNGSTKNLDPAKTISILKKGDSWVWTTKDGNFGGNIIRWGAEFAGWQTHGAGYFDTWKELRKFWPDAPLLENEQPLSPEEKEARAAARRAADEQREQQRVADEEARRQEIAATHGRAPSGWSALQKAAATSAGNYLEGRGLSRATQIKYAESIRFDRRTGFVAFKHTLADGTITGFERKRDDWNKFTLGLGGKALAVFGNPNGPVTKIVVTETGVDAVSRAQLDGLPDDTLYVSTAGAAKSAVEPEAHHFTAEHLVALAQQHANAVIEIATDRDSGGNNQAAGWTSLLEGHPGGVVRNVPVFVNDWNNVLRFPNPEMLTVRHYRKDLRKAVPPLPPPPAARPDLLPHWQAYESARPSLHTVIETIARGVDAWDQSTGRLDARRWRDDPLAARLFKEIHESISAEQPLVSAIRAIGESRLYAWHAWRAQTATYDRLQDRLQHTLAWDADKDKLDYERWRESGAPLYLGKIREIIQDSGAPIGDAIPAAINAVDVADAKGIEETPGRDVTKQALAGMQTYIANHADEFSFAPARVKDYPVFTGLADLADRLEATPTPVPDPAAWVPLPAEASIVMEEILSKGSASVPFARAAATSRAASADRVSSAAANTKFSPPLSSESSLDLDGISGSAVIPERIADAPLPTEDAYSGGPIEEEPPHLTAEEIAREVERRETIETGQGLDGEHAFAATPPEASDPTTESLMPETALQDDVLDRVAIEPENEGSAAETRAHEESMARRARAADARNRMPAATGPGGVLPPGVGAAGRPDGTVGEEFGVDNSPEKQRADFLRQLCQWYESHLSAKHEQELAWVRFRPGPTADEIVIEFRDGSRLRDDGETLTLDTKGTPQKADMMIEIAAAKGMTSLRLRGSLEFKRDLAKACYEHGIAVRNPEMQPFMESLRRAMPDRAGIYRQSATDGTSPTSEARPSAAVRTTSSNASVPGPAAPPPQTAAAANVSTETPQRDNPPPAPVDQSVPIEEVDSAPAISDAASSPSVSEANNAPNIDSAEPQLLYAYGETRPDGQLVTAYFDYGDSDIIGRVSGYIHDNDFQTGLLVRDSLAGTIVNHEKSGVGAPYIGEIPPAMSRALYPLPERYAGFYDGDRNDLREQADIAIASYLAADRNHEFAYDSGTNPEMVSQEELGELATAAKQDMLAALAKLSDEEVGQLLEEHQDTDHDGTSFPATSLEEVNLWRQGQHSDQQADAEVVAPTEETSSATPEAFADLSNFAMFIGNDPLQSAWAAHEAAQMATVMAERSRNQYEAALAMAGLSDTTRDVREIAADLRSNEVAALSLATDDMVATTQNGFGDDYRQEIGPLVAANASWPSSFEEVGDGSPLARFLAGQECVAAHQALKDAYPAGQRLAAPIGELADVRLAVANGVMLESAPGVLAGHTAGEPVAVGNITSAALTMLVANAKGISPLSSGEAVQTARLILDDKTAHPIHRAFAASAVAEAIAEITKSGQNVSNEFPTIQDMEMAEIANLTNVDTEYGMREAPTLEYAERVGLRVAALEATAELDYTIDAHIPGYNEAGLERAAMFERGLNDMSADACADILKYAVKAAAANDALAAQVTVPAHLRVTGTEYRATTAHSIRDDVQAATASSLPEGMRTSSYQHPMALFIASAASEFQNAGTATARTIAAGRLLSAVEKAVPSVSALEDQHLRPVALAERESRQAKYQLDAAKDQVERYLSNLYENPAEIRDQLATVSLDDVLKWTTSPPAPENFGPLSASLSKLAPPQQHAKLEEFNERLAHWSAAAHGFVVASTKLTQVNDALAADENVSSAQEVRSVIRDVIPWDSFKAVWGADPDNVKSATSEDTTRLDIALNVLRRAASPTIQQLSETDIAAHSVAEERDALSAWVNMDKAFEVATRQQLEPAGLSGDRPLYEAFMSAESATDAAHSAYQCAMRTGHEALQAAAGQVAVEATGLANQASKALFADPSALAYATEQGAADRLALYGAHHNRPDSTAYFAEMQEGQDIGM